MGQGEAGQGSRPQEEEELWKESAHAVRSINFIFMTHVDGVSIRYIFLALNKKASQPATK